MNNRSIGDFSSASRARDPNLRSWIVSAAFGIVSFLYVFTIIRWLGLAPKLRDASIFISGGALIPLLCGCMQSKRIMTCLKSANLRSFETVTIWATISVFVALLVVQAAAPFFENGEAIWSEWSFNSVIAVTAVHFGFCLSIWFKPGLFDRFNLSSIGKLLNRGVVQAAVFLVAASYSAVSLFWFNVTTASWNGFSGMVKSIPFASASYSMLTTAGAFAILFLCTTAAAWRTQGYDAKEGVFTRLVLITITIVSIVNFFDFSLALEVLHYLTNVGPAMLVRHGGMPMVDAFSQYGLAPIILTYLAYFVGPLTLGTAQVLVQLCNLMFCAVWLGCLYQMSDFKVAALLLGFLAIALQFAAWNFGDGNLAVAPSILGLRHLPAILLVLAISRLKAPDHYSVFTFASLVLAALWSFEALVGAICIVFGFLVATNLRDRTARRCAREVALVAASVFSALVLFSAVTWLTVGRWPAFDVYLSFITVYNPLSTFWAHPAASTFLGWTIPLLAIFLAFAETVRRAIDRTDGGLMACRERDALFYRFFPMALLTLDLSAYFAFRSYDYTLAIALLPTMALIIPAALALVQQLGRGPRAVRRLAAIPAALCFILATYAIVVLTRPGGPYVFYIHQCRDRGLCGLTALSADLGERLHLRDVLQPTGNVLSDRYIQMINSDGMLSDTVSAISSHVPMGSRATVLVGRTLISELAMLYTDTWQRWPISFLFTDQLVERLAERIATASVSIPPRDIVIISASSTFTPLEQKIWDRLRREYQLCKLPEAPSTIIVYRVASPNEICSTQPVL